MDSARLTREIKQYLDVLFTPANPVYISLLLFVIIISIVYFFYKFAFYPLKRKYYSEKKLLQQENKEIIALFAELDPDPILRVDAAGRIIHSNKAFRSITSNSAVSPDKITDIIPDLKIDIIKCINTNESLSLYKKIGEEYYSILLQGISKYKIMQVYFHNISELKKYEAQLMEFSQRQQEQIENERQRISYELHDGIGQNLSIVRIIVNKLAKEHPLKEKEFTKAVELLGMSIKELKRISFNLKPRILEEMGLEPALILLCETIHTESGIKGEIDIQPLNKRLESKLEIDLFRITQETLNNIVKHSDAKNFSVRLMQKDNTVRLVVSDDGIGFDWEKTLEEKMQKGLGLMSIHERTKLNSGKVKIDSEHEKGTIIKVDIPLKEY